ncbi:MAG TPA: hypothetical protein PKM73_13395 [Verrucomicrobiota bacterium]|nr:hypothetical protein [Verrucomicrobiota bacterium]HNU52207.1 hypothetical protein [Verrucomicrobiota bacterium]
MHDSTATSGRDAPQPSRPASQRWGVLAALALVVVACLVLAVRQQAQIRALERRIESLRSAGTAAEATPARPVSSAAPAVPGANPGGPIRAVGGSAEPGAGSGPLAARGELDRLRREAAQLTGEVRRLESVAAENQALRSALAQTPASLPPELQPLAQARDRARSIACVNNLKQLGLAARIYANDNQDWLPATVAAMSNELVTPKILACPADPAHPPAADWSGFSAANQSYEYLAPLVSNVEPQRVVFRCSLHGHVGLGDGSVQQQPTNGVLPLVQRGGKLYLE